MNCETLINADTNLKLSNHNHSFMATGYIKTQKNICLYPDNFIFNLKKLLPIFTKHTFELFDSTHYHSVMTESANYLAIHTIWMLQAF